jgi:23S rRNA (cytidine1920-2'-O)/16S rRNA (cytidine1409-2'-O)-methyltransferase
MRIDKYLFEKGYFQSRQSAKDHIEAGLVSVNGSTDVKPSLEVDEQTQIKVIGKLHEFVSRGGLKLKAALELFEVDVKNKIAVDIGSSTGGFTDCLLQYGAKEVYAVDSGKDQLHHTLKEDQRVHSYESTNARYLTHDTYGVLFDIAVMDVSFISQTLLYNSVSNLLVQGGIFVSLIKPQFEVGKKYVGKGGIVKDTAVFNDVFRNICDRAFECSLVCKKVIPSPILGKDGNKEFLAYFVKERANELVYPNFPEKF